MTSNKISSLLCFVGVLLFALGLATGFGIGLARAPLANAIWVSFYLIWIGLCLGAVWGTGRALPLAGAGHAAALWQERTAIAPVAIGSFGSLGAITMLLVQWHWNSA
jgi:(hydroxyamino)benzene mutase